MFSTTLSHYIDGAPKMVNVQMKDKTRRFAHARAIVQLPPPAMEALKTIDLQKKGSPLHVATIGGIMAAKQTHNLIPLCHQIPLDGVDVDIVTNNVDSNQLFIDCKVSAYHHTGVEMEAIVGASIAACVVYDMLKAASHGIVIESIKLVEKKGGKRDYSISSS